MFSVEYDKTDDFLSRLIDCLMNTNFNEIVVNNGKDLEKLYHNELEASPKDSIMFNEVLKKFVNEACKDDPSRAAAVQSDVVYSKTGYYCFTSDTLRNEHKLGDLEYEYILPMEGRNYSEVLNILYETFSKSDIPFSIVAKSAKRKGNIYEISVLCDKEHKEQTEYILDTLDLMPYLANVTYLGCRVNDKIYYDTHFKGENLSTTSKLENILFEGLLEDAKAWALTGNDDALNDLDFDHTDNLGRLIKGCIKSAEVYNDNYRNELKTRLVAKLKDAGLNVDSLYESNEQQEEVAQMINEEEKEEVEEPKAEEKQDDEFVRTISVVQPIIKHEEFLKDEEGNQVLTDEGLPVPEIVGDGMPINEAFNFTVGQMQDATKAFQEKQQEEIVSGEPDVSASVLTVAEQEMAKTQEVPVITESDLAQVMPEIDPAEPIVNVKPIEEVKANPEETEEEKDSIDEEASAMRELFEQMVINKPVQTEEAVPAAIEPLNVEPIKLEETTGTKEETSPLLSSEELQNLVEESNNTVENTNVLNNDETASLVSEAEAPVMENTTVLTNAETQSLIDAEVIGKYNGILNEQEASQMITKEDGSQIRLIDYLENGHILDLVPLGIKIVDVNEQVMTGADFIKNIIIPAITTLPYTEVIDLIQRYAPTYYESLQTPQQQVETPVVNEEQTKKRGLFGLFGKKK